MTLQSAIQIKDAITENTGFAARVTVKGGEFTAEQILPAGEQQLSTVQRTALYVVYKNRSGADDGCGLQAAVNSGVFDSRTQAQAVLSNLASFGWLRETAINRYALTEKSNAFINRRLSAATMQA